MILDLDSQIVMKGEETIALTYTEFKILELLVSNKKKIYGVSVSSTTAAQDSSVASWCRSQVGKSYNYNYLNVTTRSKFYCSQLVWAGYKDLYKIDLNTSTFGKAIHPMELVNSSQTYTFYTYKK